MNRLTRKEACAFIGCGMSKLYDLERTGELEGTYYQIGKRRLYITERLREWIENGGTRTPEEKMQ